MKKILIISWNFFPKLGGAESIVLSQARYFVKKGYAVAVITSKHQGQPDDETIDGIKVMRRDAVNSSVRISKERIEKDLSDIINIFHPNLVQFHNGCYPSGSSDMRSGVANVLTIFEYLKKYKLPILDYAHNAQLKDPEATKLLRELPWDGIIMVSNFVERKWKELGFKANNTIVIHNGVDFEKFAEAKPSANLKKIIGNNFSILFPSRIIRPSTGGFSEQKNFMMLLQACGSLVSDGVNNFKLLAILDDFNPNNKVHKYVAQRIQENNMVNNIEFVSSVPYDNIPGYFKAVDAICVPSVNEAFSLTYIEAMAAGKVTIGTNTGGTPELIDNNKNGFMVEPSDIGGLAETLRGLIEDEAKYQIIAEMAQKTAKEFTLEKMSEEVLRVYQPYL